MSERIKLPVGIDNFEKLRREKGYCSDFYLLGRSSGANLSAGRFSAFFLSRTGTSDTAPADPSRSFYLQHFVDV